MGIQSVANSGLKASMKNMESISNNIANVNTIGYKKTNVNFADVSVRSLSAGNQVGLGVKINSIKQDFSSGNIESTSSGTDLSLLTDGFFVQKDPNGGYTSYTRAGRLEVDANGYLNGLGGRIQGYPAVNGKVAGSGILVDMQIPDALVPPVATTQNDIMLNLDSSSIMPTIPFNEADPNSYNFRTDSVVYDSLGQSHTLTVYYVKQSDDTWGAQMFADNTTLGLGTLNFEGNGNLAAANGFTNISWSPGNGAVTPQNLNLNFTGATQFSSENKVYTNAQDGYEAGEPLGFNIDKDGKVNVAYSNGQTITQGQIAVAHFKAPAELSRFSDMSWVSTLASGDPILSVNNSNGAINPGTVELSNVDITEELVKLLGAQHDFQANAQVQQTYNQLLQKVEQL